MQRRPYRKSRSTRGRFATRPTHGFATGGALMAAVCLTCTVPNPGAETAAPVEADSISTSQPDAPQQSGDRDTAPARQASGPDAAVDGRPSTSAGCGTWAGWECAEDALFLCSARCGAARRVGAAVLNCLPGGDCICGFGIDTCGRFRSDDPCDVCRQAFEAGCCPVEK